MRRGSWVKFPAETGNDEAIMALKTAYNRDSRSKEALITYDIYIIYTLDQ